MKKFLLDTKWIGALCVVIVAFVVAYLSGSYAVRTIKAVMPTAVTEISQFLPITIENGTIVEPKDTIISKNYGNQDRQIMVVLDTRVDELSTDDIKNEGMYVSRKYIYGVTREKTEIRNLSELPNATVDQQLLEKGAEWLENNSEKYLFLSIFLGLCLYIGIVVLIYAALIYLLLGMVLKVGFEQTLRVTTLGYLALFIVGCLAVSTGVIATFILLLIINYLNAKYIAQPAD